MYGWVWDFETNDPCITCNYPKLVMIGCLKRPSSTCLRPQLRRISDTSVPTPHPRQGKDSYSCGYTAHCLRRHNHSHRGCSPAQPSLAESCVQHSSPQLRTVCNRLCPTQLPKSIAMHSPQYSRGFPGIALQQYIQRGILSRRLPITVTCFSVLSIHRLLLSTHLSPLISLISLPRCLQVIASYPRVSTPVLHFYLSKIVSNFQSYKAALFKDVNTSNTSCDLNTGASVSGSVIQITPNKGSTHNRRGQQRYEHTHQKWDVIPC